MITALGPIKSLMPALGPIKPLMPALGLIYNVYFQSMVKNDDFLNEKYYNGYVFQVSQTKVISSKMHPLLYGEVFRNHLESVVSVLQSFVDS